jgi:hypothetical protein
MRRRVQSIWRRLGGTLGIIIVIVMFRETTHLTTAVVHNHHAISKRGLANHHVLGHRSAPLGVVRGLAFSRIFTVNVMVQDNHRLKVGLYDL